MENRCAVPSAHTALGSGFVLTGESFYHIGNCSLPLRLVSEVFILETDSLVTKKTIKFLSSLGAEFFCFMKNISGELLNIWVIA